jgi:hypothetical protein
MTQIRRALIGDDRGRISIPVNAGLMVVMSILLLVLPGVALLPAIVMLSITLAFIAVFIAIIFDDEIRLGRNWLAFASGLALICVVLCFAGVYHVESESHPHAFSVKLGRLSATYFAIGTMSTAGTNGVKARSKSAEGELALQELVDFTALALLFGGVIRRLGLPAARNSSIPQGIHPKRRRDVSHEQRSGDSGARGASRDVHKPPG